MMAAPRGTRAESASSEIGEKCQQPGRARSGSRDRGLLASEYEALLELVQDAAGALRVAAGSGERSDVLRRELDSQGEDLLLQFPQSIGARGRLIAVQPAPVQHLEKGPRLGPFEELPRLPAVAGPGQQSEKVLVELVHRLRVHERGALSLAGQRGSKAVEIGHCGAVCRQRCAVSPPISASSPS